MELIGNLIQLLKSQLALYTEIRDTLEKEKSFIVGWNFTDIPDLVKEKNSLFRKETILEEARKSLVGRVAENYNLEEPNLFNIASACQNKEQKEVLFNLRNSLSNVAAEISRENTALKLLYSTNIRLINDLYVKMGFMETSNRYGMDKGKGYSSVPATFTVAG